MINLVGVVVEEIETTETLSVYCVQASGIDFVVSHTVTDKVDEFRSGFAHEDNWLYTIAAAQHLGVRTDDFWSVVQPQLELIILAHEQSK